MFTWLTLFILLPCIHDWVKLFYSKQSPCSNKCKAAGTGQAGQAKTGSLFSAFGLVMIVDCIDRMVKIVAYDRACSVQPDDCQDLYSTAFLKVLISFDPNSKVLLRSFKADKCMMGINAWNLASHPSSSSIKAQISYILESYNWGNLQMTLGF